MAESSERVIPASVTAADDAPAPDALPRRLGVWTYAAVVMGVIIGSGVFRTPASIAEMAGSVGGVAIIWVLGGLVTLCLALCLAELAAMFPQSGGIYVYLREAFGPGLSFVFGWVFLLVNPAQWAAITAIFAEYLGTFIALTPTGKRFVASIVIIGVCTANYVSLRFTAAIQNFATSGKAFAITAVAVAIFALGNGSAGSFAEPVSFAMPSLGAFGVALIAVLWPYEGVAGACALSGEVRNPAYTLPRALILSMTGVIILYLLINVAYLYVLPLPAVAGSELVASDAMKAVAGPAGAQVIAACVMLSTFGSVAAASMMDPRVFYALGKDGLFFKRVGAVHPRFQTPHVAIVISAVLAIAYVWVRTFEELAAQFILGLWLFYALAVVALIVLRIKRPDAVRPYKVLGYPIVPIVFIVCSFGLLVNSLIELPRISLMNLAVTCAGIPVYFIWQRLRRAPR